MNCTNNIPLVSIFISQKSPAKDDLEDTRQNLQSDSPKDIKELKIPISFSASCIKVNTQPLFVNVCCPFLLFSTILFYTLERENLY